MDWGEEGYGVTEICCQKYATTKAKVHHDSWKTIENFLACNKRKRKHGSHCGKTERQKNQTKPPRRRVVVWLCLMGVGYLHGPCILLGLRLEYSWKAKPFLPAWPLKWILISCLRCPGTQPFTTIRSKAPPHQPGICPAPHMQTEGRTKWGIKTKRKKAKSSWINFENHGRHVWAAPAAPAATDSKDVSRTRGNPGWGYPSVPHFGTWTLICSQTFHALRVSCLRKRGKETGRRSWLGRTGLIIIVAGDNRKMGGKDSCHVDESKSTFTLAFGQLFLRSGPPPAKTATIIRHFPSPAECPLSFHILDRMRRKLFTIYKITFWLINFTYCSAISYVIFPNLFWPPKMVSSVFCTSPADILPGSDNSWQMAESWSDVGRIYAY